MAPVIRRFPPLTRAGQNEVDIAVKRDLHPQTRVAKHLTRYCQAKEYRKWWRAAHSHFDDGTDDGAKNNLSSQ